MKIHNSLRLMGALTAVLALAAGAISFAAEGTPGSQPQARDRSAETAQPGAPGDARGGRFERGFNRLERRLDYLHERLEIRPSQDTAWRNFSEALRQEAATRRNQFQDSFRDEERRLAPPTAMERLEQRQRMLTGMRDSLDRVIGALRPLYAALDENQRRAADELFPRSGLMDRAGRRGFGPRGEFFNRRVPVSYEMSYEGFYPE
jgi:hypothetical protein